MPKRTAKEYKLVYDWPERLLTSDLDLTFEALDVELQEIILSVCLFPDIANPEKIAAELLDVYLLSKGFRLAKDFPGISLTETEKRKLAILAVPLHRQKGTAAGIINIIRLLLGIEAAVITQYNIAVWKVGLSELGVDTVLFPDTVILGDSYPLYAFDIETIVPVTPEEDAKIRALAEYMKPIHTHLIQVITPEEPPDHWELDISLLGDEIELHE